MNDAFQILDVTPDNLCRAPLCGIKDPGHEGRLAKEGWMQTALQHGLRQQEALGAGLLPASVVGLSGALGSGKTCLVQGIALGLGVDPAYAVTSPTFTLINEYPGRIRLYHVDLYRLDPPADAALLGLDELFEGDGVVVVEWFERLADAYLAAHIRIDLDIVDDSLRRLAVVSGDLRYAALVQQLNDRFGENP